MARVLVANFSTVPFVPGRPFAPRRGDVQERIRRLFARPCAFDVHAAVGAGLAPHEVEAAADWWALHQGRAEMARRVALCHVLLWGPEVAAEAAQFRPDDRLHGSGWASQAAALVAAGVLDRFGRAAYAIASGLRQVARWLEICLHTGPPAVSVSPGRSVRVISP